MARIIKALLLATLVTGGVLLAPSAASAASESATVKVEANVRSEPNTTSRTLREVQAGASVDVTCWVAGEATYGADKYGSMWLRLDDGGFVHSFLVTPVDVPPCRGDQAGTFYENCDAARAAGAAPVFANEPGYAPHLDRDGDGIGCEWD